MKYVQRQEAESGNWFLLLVSSCEVVAVRGPEEGAFRNPDGSLIDEIEPIKREPPKRPPMSDPLGDMR